MTDREGAVVCPSCGANRDPESAPVALPPRTVLNERFLVGRLLGRPGGFGITYLARDLTLRITVAIKEFLPSTFASRATDRATVVPNTGDDRAAFRGGLEEFLEEARILVSFSHPNIARVRDFFTANGTAYLVMDYYEGTGLDQYVRERSRPLREEEALEVFLPVLAGLEAVHERGFLHRDIKPPNIHLSRDGTPILLDFGAARLAIGERSRDLTVMLTAGFAPFEQYHRRGRQGPWTDIYACGATLYYLVTGTAPPDAIERYTEDTLEAPGVRNRALSESFSDAIMRALSIDPAGRPQTVSAFRAWLLGTTTRDAAMATGGVPRSRPAHTPRGDNAAEPIRPSPAAGARRPLSGRVHQGPGTGGWTLGRVVLLTVLGVSAWGGWHALRDGSTEDTAESTGIRPSMVRSPPAVPARVEPPSVDVDPETVNESTGVALDPRPVSRVEVPHPPYTSVPGEPPAPPAWSAPVPAEAHGPRRPPQEAMEACAGKRSELSCSFQTPHGRESGLCRSVGRLLACVPFGAPPMRRGGPGFGSRP